VRVGKSHDVSRLEQLGPWVARGAWVVLALAAGGPLTDALADRSDPVRLVAVTLLGGAWTGGLVALLVPRTTSLTAVRVLVPAGLATAMAAAVAGSTADGADLVAVAAGTLATVAVLSPWFTETWVDGSSYGPEHRLPLQTPSLLAVTVVPLSWLAAVAGTVTGPLLLAATQWVGGGVALVVGGAVARQAVRSLHQLSRRWVVLVPAGLVLHDPLILAEPQLFPRLAVATLQPAPADTDAVDLTGGASGLALELALTEPVDLLVLTGRGRTETVEARSLLFTPARPAHLLDRARHHRLRVPA
jgi:hypothetical protein